MSMWRMVLMVVGLMTTGLVYGQDLDDVFPFSTTVFELDNGLRIISVPYDSPGIVAYYTVVRTGSRNEVDSGFSGYAHFFEHMMFRGTEKYPTWSMMFQFRDLNVKIGSPFTMTVIEGN